MVLGELGGVGGEAALEEERAPANDRRKPEETPRRALRAEVETPGVTP